MDAKLLKAIATQKGVTMIELAKAVGITRQALHYLMIGESKWTLDKVRAVKSALVLTDEQVRDIFLI